MTVTASYSPLYSAGNGVTTSFSAAWPIFASTDIKVDLYDTSLGSLLSPAPVLNGGGTYDYTVTLGAQDTNTGEYASATVVLNNAPAAKYRIIRQRQVAAAQPSQFLNNTAFPAPAVEQFGDRLAMALQQSNAAASLFSIRIPFTDGLAASVTLPSALLRADTVMGFDSAGGVKVIPDATASATIAQNAAAAALASQVAAAGSAAAAAVSQLAAAASAVAAAASAAAADVDKIVWRGAWSGVTAYVANDAVSSGGSSYICILGHTNHVPPNATYWNVLAQRGTDGVGSGDVVGPASAGDNSLPLYDGTTGKLIKAGVALGTAGQVLMSNGAGAAPSFQAAAGGGTWVKIGRSPASGSASLVVTGLDGTYDQYAIVLDALVPATDNVAAWLRYGDSGGVLTGASYQYGYNKDSFGGTIAAAGASGQTKIILSEAGVGDAANNGFYSGLLFISRTSARKMMWGQSVNNYAASPRAYENHGFYGSAITLDRISFEFSSGNVSTGSLTVYGIKHT